MAVAVLIICFVAVLVQGGESYSSWFHSDSLHVYSQPAGCNVDVPTVGRNTQVRRHKTQMIDTTHNDTLHHHRHNNGEGPLADTFRF